MLRESANTYFSIDTTNNSEAVYVGANTRLAVIDSLDLSWFNSDEGNADGRVFTKTGAVQTTDATQTVLITFSTQSNTSGWAEAHVAGRSGTNSDAYVIRVKWENAAGTVTLSSISTDWTVEDVAEWDATFTASGAAIRVSVTGAAATTINWSGELKIQEAR